MHYNIISSTSSTATIEISLEDLQTFLRLAESLKKDRNARVQNDDIKFRRKIIPYFLNKFYHYVIERGERQAIDYLKHVKKAKTSNQGKFELCDIRNLFRNPQNESIQDLWIDFLCDSRSYIMSDRRIAENRQLYISYIPVLLREASKKEFAYNKFLSGRYILHQQNNQFSDEEGHIINEGMSSTDKFIQEESDMMLFQPSFDSLDIYNTDTQ